MEARKSEAERREMESDAEQRRLEMEHKQRQDMAYRQQQQQHHYHNPKVRLIAAASQGEQRQQPSHVSLAFLQDHESKSLCQIFISST